jgi:hypothetical protein
MQDLMLARVTVNSTGRYPKSGGKLKVPGRDGSISSHRRATNCRSSDSRLVGILVLLDNCMSNSVTTAGRDTSVCLDEGNNVRNVDAMLPEKLSISKDDVLKGNHLRQGKNEK